VNAGIEIQRQYSVERDGQWQLLESPFAVRQGELVRVDLYVSLPAARHFVVVEDPLPGGLEAVQGELATSSRVDLAKAEEQFPPDAIYRRYDDWHFYGYSRWSFYHRELRHEAARFYSEYLSAGRYHLSYVAQAIAPGEFFAPPAQASEMYEPETFGRGRPGTFIIEADTALP
jgi:uncharacterized protein YfaS (alpha-2-macroglobulin family)